MKNFCSNSRDLFLFEIIWQAFYFVGFFALILEFFIYEISIADKIDC